jgi:hypothetical protein
MSTIAMSWAMAQEITTVTKMILVALADHHNAETGQCNPSVKRICHVAGTTPRTVATHIKSLTISGHLTVTPAARTDGSQTSNDYHLTLYAGAPATSDPPAAVAYHEPVTSNSLPELLSFSKPETEPKETIETNVSTSKKRPFQITEEFRAKMAERFGGVFGDTLNERIDEALTHTSAKKYSNIQSYVTGWLRRDAERNGKRASPSPPTPPSQPPSGWTDNNGRLLSRKERQQEVGDAKSR